MLSAEVLTSASYKNARFIISKQEGVSHFQLKGISPTKLNCLVFLIPFYSGQQNLERVWAAEKKADEEKAKLAEYQKQINEERQIQELRQLQVASGQVVKTVDTTLDWMYEGPSAGIQAQQSSEEYLLGKIYKPQENKIHEDGMLGIFC